MSVQYFETPRESDRKGNYISLGRQPPRTTPLPDVKKCLDFCSEDLSEDHEEPQQNVAAGARDQDDNDQDRTFDFNTVETKNENISEPDHPTSVLKGMTGYQLTLEDLEFIKKMKEEKLIKKLQGELEEVQRLLKKESMALELVCATREKAQAELNKFPSCEELGEWLQVVLTMTSPATDLTGLDPKSLLAMVTQDNVQRAVDEKRIELTRLEMMMANKRKKEAKERGKLEKQIATEQLKILGLMNELSDLRSELAQQEETYKALQTQIKAQEEIKVGAEDTSEEEAAKSQVKRQGKERKKTVKFTEKLQDTINQNKSARSKRTNGKTESEANVKDDHANENTNETLKTSTTKQTKQTPEAVTEEPTKSKAQHKTKAARGTRKKVLEQEVSGRRKLPVTAQASASQPKNLTKVKTGKAGSVAPDDVGDEAQSAGLRRSKRIASRR